MKTPDQLRTFAAAAALIVTNICLITLVGAQDDPSATNRDREPNAVITRIDGPAGVAADEVRFEAIDIFVDSGDTSLAAYQFELSSDTPGVEFVGIEGGEHKAFSEPPFYDPRAMNNSRVILAAFSTAKELPKGRTRMARIHVQLEGPGLKEYRTKLSVSATTDGEEIPATVLIARAGQ